MVPLEDPSFVDGRVLSSFAPLQIAGAVVSPLQLLPVVVAQKDSEGAAQWVVVV